jgi:CheY-like chemotaxis protein
MDCNMPVMDGFKATSAIRTYLSSCVPNGYTNPRQPLIAALTAYTTESFEELSQQAGMDRFLTKPLNVEKLKEVMLEAGIKIEE